MLAPFEAAFAGALLDPKQPIPHDVTAHNAVVPTRRFAVYRNNVVTGLVKALKSRFPVIEKIVDEEFFAAMARAFVVERPQRTPLLATYGDEFAAFIAAFEPARELAYLADVARLEAARTRAYHAADATPVDAEPVRGARSLRCRWYPHRFASLDRNRSLATSDRHDMGDELQRAGCCTH